MMRNGAKLLGVGLTLASILTGAWTPVQPQAEDLTVRVTQVDRSHFPQVTVYVSATDAAGAPVPFSADELRIEENGVAVEMSAVEGVAAVGPLSTLLVMDVSGSMDVAGKLDAAKAAARAYVEQMRPGDQAGLLAFDVEIDYVQPLTADRQALSEAIDGLTARRDTAMYDALIRASEILRPASGRKAVLVLTDGMDNSSRATLDDVLAGIGPAGLSISTIGLGNVRKVGASFEGLDEAALTELARGAGGEYGFAEESSMLVEIYERLGRTLQSEYTITYTSPSSLRDGVNRTIRVTLTGAASGAEVYNPGGVVPEVPQEAATMIFLVGLAVLLGLLILPGAAGWVLGRVQGWVPKRRPAARVRLQEPVPAPTAPRTQSQTRIRLRS
jgi:VWFA-related protein